MHNDIDHIDVSWDGKVITFWFKDGTSKFIAQPYNIGCADGFLSLACALLVLQERYERLELRLSRLEVSTNG